jgi:hypothetical protein
MKTELNNKDGIVNQFIKHKYLNNSVGNIMKERIEEFNRFVMSKDINSLPIGLFCGKMGLCIYFYHQARDSGNRRHKIFADKLLNSILNQLNDKTVIDLEDGLIGVCLGLNYLLEKGFKKGNINYILSELDDKIYYATWFHLLDPKPNLSLSNMVQPILEAALYFSIRLQHPQLKQNNRFLFESIVIKAINNIQNSYDYQELFSEPQTYSINQYLLTNYIYVLSLVYKLGFYNYKINKIFDEIYPKLTSSYPILQSNRLQLQSTLSILNIHLKSELMDTYVKRLKQEIDYVSMIKTEFRNKNILLADGICGVYILQNMLFKNREFPKAMIIEKIIQSELWNDVSKNEDTLNSTIGLFTGLAGVILVYQQLTKKIIS